MTSRSRATITDVAAAAGVSRQTVTRAMNDMADIAPATRARVLRAARELRYRPSRVGRELVRGQRRTIALVVHSLVNPYYPELASATVGAAARKGWNVVLADTRYAASTTDLLAELGEQVDVVVGYLGAVPAEHRQDLLPLVVIDGDDRTPQAVVRLDTTGAMTDLAEHLHRQGVRRPAVVVPGAQNRRAAEFTDAMAWHGVPVRVVAYTDSTPAGPELDALAGGVRAAQILAADPHDARVDAVLGFNDITACGVLKGLRRAGIGVPDQMRVAGIDGLSLGTAVSPELTTLALDLDQVAAHAVDLAIEIFDGGSAPPPANRRVAHRLLLRESA